MKLGEHLTLYHQRESLLPENQRDWLSVGTCVCDRPEPNRLFTSSSASLLSLSVCKESMEEDFYDGEVCLLAFLFSEVIKCHEIRYTHCPRIPAC